MPTDNNKVFINSEKRELLISSLIWYLFEILDVNHKMDKRDTPYLDEILAFTPAEEEPINNPEILMEAIELREQRLEILAPFFLELAELKPDFIELTDKLTTELIWALETRIAYNDNNDKIEDLLKWIYEAKKS